MALVARMKRSAIRVVHRAHASRIGIRATACNRHCEPAVPGPIPHTALKQSPRHCERSAAVHAVRGHGLLHCVRNDEAVHGKRSAVIHSGAAWKKMDPCHRTKKTNPVQVNLLGFEAKVLVTKYLAHLIKQVLGLGKIGDRVHRIKTRYETWYRRRKP